MRGGKLRTLVRLEQPVTTQDPFGNPVPTWTLVVETYASKKVASGRESEVFEQRVASYDTEWRFRYRSPFDPRWRIVEVVTGTVHDITFAADPDGYRREILCRTRIAEPQPATAQVP
jgi:head-tail adaptor